MTRSKLLLSLGLALLCLRSALAAEPSAQSLAAAYPSDIRPLVVRLCHDCHSADQAEADLDLSQFASFEDVKKQAELWQKVDEMLDSRQMPPPDAAQPTDAERERLQGWVRSFLTVEAAARAGDPGQVVLRRLSNAEYTYTLHDLTGVESLDPAREFPIDGAAGEGFTNTGSALVMSPALVAKYLDAAKEVTAHAVLLPNGFRFSPHTTRRDWTNDKLAEIRAFYAPYTDGGGGDQVNLQGIVFDTNAGGRLPLERYLGATLAEREALLSGQKSIEAVAAERQLNAKYMRTLWNSLTSPEPSLVLDMVRVRWRKAKPEEAGALAAEIAAWQQGLWRFATVGHIGKVGGPKAWLEPVSPLVARQELRLKLPPADGDAVTVSLVASDAGDGNEHDVVIWEDPRLVAPGRPDLALKDLRAVSARLIALRKHVLASSDKYLRAAAKVQAAKENIDVAALARSDGLDADILRAWLEYLGVGPAAAVELKGHFENKLESAGGYDFVQGWGSHETPLVLANASDKHVRVPGNMPPRSIAVHPSPKLRAGIGWQSPLAASVRIEGSVTHAHPECGNGVSWSLVHLRGKVRRSLATGIAHGGTPAAIPPVESLAVQAGDVVSLLVAPRDGNHSCDLTTVDLKIASLGDAPKTWRLADDVAESMLAGNPHADRHGNPSVWHFYAEPDAAGEIGPVIPAGSLLAKWQAATEQAEREVLADNLHALLGSDAVPPADTPDGALYRQLSSLGGPLLKGAWNKPVETDSTTAASSEYGLDPASFGKHPAGGAVDAACLCVQAPSSLVVTIPADLAAGAELVAIGRLDAQAGQEGTAQLELAAGRAKAATGLRRSAVAVTSAGGQWTDDSRRTSFSSPIVAMEGSAARRRVEQALDEFRQLFPAALCYTKIVPVDEVVTLTLHYREDEHLVRLMLNDAERQELDRLWDELHYISHDALTLVDALAQLIEFATQDADPKVFEPLREPFSARAAAFRQRLLDTEPAHMDALVAFAARAWRRPLTSNDEGQLRGLYAGLRQQGLAHEEAFRLTLARVLVAPAFLYKLETPVPGTEQTPLSDFELATRLSYFLWSSKPDDELRRLAAEGKLRDTEMLLAQTRRMLADPKTRRLATEFACQWLQIYDFDQLDEKSERQFPTFASLRGDMHEESIQFFTDLFQNNRPVLNIIAADYTFLNDRLAAHYGISGIDGSAWRRVDGMKQHARGGVLAQASTLAKQSGASRTSPILRGTWISEVLLGERLPRPPKGVPPLPDEAPAAGLSVRQLVERHVSDPKCAVCHRRIDPLGFSLEAFDAIGRHRQREETGQAIDASAETFDGAKFEGLAGLQHYLGTMRRDDVLRQFCKKLLGYALGRSVQLSDEPLLTKMQADLAASDYRVHAAIEAIVESRQFREIRGRDRAYNESE